MSSSVSSLESYEMSTVVPPNRPMPPRPVAGAVPAPPRPTVPQAAPVVSAPPVAAAPVAPVTAPPVAVAPVETAAETKKRGRQALPPYPSLFAVDPATGQYVTVNGADGSVEYKTIKLEFVPKCGTGEGEYDHNKYAPLKPNCFKKRGDFYRFQSALCLAKSDEFLKQAADADTGKTRSSKYATMAAEYSKLLEDTLKMFQDMLPPDVYEAKKAELLAKHAAMAGSPAA